MIPPQQYDFPADSTIWQYNFAIDPEAAFIQEGTASDPRIYWLDVQAEPLDSQAHFGWKTSPAHWNDHAVWGQGPEPYSGPWDRLEYPPGHEMQGQPVDLAFVVAGPADARDFGDAPDPPYPTREASGGAVHGINGWLQLGPGIDADADGQPDPDAMGDDNDGTDDEDGVAFSLLVPGQTAAVELSLTSDGAVDAFIDFNGDGSWLDPDDRLFSFGLHLSVGTWVVDFEVPAGATPGIDTFARVRLSATGGLGPDGPADSGEVEDYQVHIEAAPVAKWRQDPDLDITGTDLNIGCSSWMADDFRCTSTGPINAIWLWGSWFEDFYGADSSDISFFVKIYSDIPADVNPNGYSTPGEILWEKTYPVSSFATEIWVEDILEGFWSPPAGLYVFPGDSTCILYRLPVPVDEVFVQEGTPENPVVYWLGVQGMPSYPWASPGWKTSREHWNDAAAHAAVPTGPWIDLQYPAEHPLAGQSVALAFALFGDEPASQFDFGDAPDPAYPTLLASDGARHAVPPDPAVYLGEGVDTEPDGLPGAGADGDDIAGWDDEDGVEGNLLVPGGVVTIEVVASVDGWLNAWVDWDADGSWSEANDHVFIDQWLTAGPNVLSLAVPETGSEGYETCARLRFSTEAGLGPTGAASDGEVEDYLVAIQDDLTGATDAVPARFGLDQNVPNPFNPETAIRYDVPAGGGRIRLEIFDAKGRLVRVLVDGFRPEGSHTSAWDGRDAAGRMLPTGIYLCRLRAAGCETTRKMLMLQ